MLAALRARLRTLGRFRAALALVLVAALVSVLVYRSWVDAQARAAAVLAVTLKVPALGWTTRVLTAEPRSAERLVAGVPTTVVRPGRGSRWPTLVFVNGVTARGRKHPDVARLARALARVGFLVLVPDPPGLARGEITERTAAATLAVARASASRPDARGGRVGLLGVSVGGSLALLAAEDPSLAGRVDVVAGIAPYSDLVNALRLATTGYTLEEGRLVPYAAKSFLPLILARSLVAALPPSRERSALRTELLRLPDDAPHPLALFRRLRPADVDPTVRPLVELLANRDPRRFDRLYAALPPALRAGVARLSPLGDAARLRAPVEIASAPHDKYFPLGETRALAEAARRTEVRLTVTSSSTTRFRASRCRRSPTSFASTAGWCACFETRAARERNGGLDR
jgi:pimeloyl-ACP methyl ester carboxylesterase